LKINHVNPLILEFIINQNILCCHFVWMTVLYVLFVSLYCCRGVFDKKLVLSARTARY